jgi:hypothetical protein
LGDRSAYSAEFLINKTWQRGGPALCPGSCLGDYVRGEFPAATNLLVTAKSGGLRRIEGGLKRNRANYPGLNHWIFLNSANQ